MAMNLPTLRQLRAFATTIEIGSLTQAARVLHLTQPAISQQIRELQRVLGVRLLERADGRLVPTAAGAAILGPAQRAQAAISEVAAVALACRSGDAGRVRLGTGATACIYLLPPILASVRRRMPGLEIIVETGNTPDILRRVEQGTLDAGLVTLPTALDRGLARVKLRRDELVALIPATTAFDGAVTPAQLAAQPLILYERSGDTRGIVDAWFRKAGVTPRPIMELGSVEAIKVLVGSGLGSSVLPRLALDQDVPGARRVALRPAAARELGLVLRKEKILDRGMQALTRALELAR
jgi:DNA-binding transcriptional LysR family regulator